MHKSTRSLFNLSVLLLIILVNGVCSFPVGISAIYSGLAKRNISWGIKFNEILPFSSPSSIPISNPNNHEEISSFEDAEVADLVAYYSQTMALTSKYHIYWNVKEKMLEMLLVFNTTAIKNTDKGYFSIGFGKTLSDPEKIIVLYSKTAYRVYEQLNSGTKLYGKSMLATLISGTLKGSKVAIELRRPLAPTDASHVAINPQKQGLYWSFGKLDGDTPAYPTKQDIVTVNLVDHGLSEARPAAIRVTPLAQANSNAEYAYQARLMHGITMYLVVLVVFPAGVVVHKLWKIKWIHITIQSIGFGLIVLGALPILVSDGINLTTSHAKVALFGIFLLVLHGVAGFLSCMTTSPTVEYWQLMKNDIVAQTRIYHYYSGHILMPALLIPVFLGMNMMLPFEEGYNYLFWFGTVLLVVIWALALIFIDKAARKATKIAKKGGLSTLRINTKNKSELWMEDIERSASVLKTSFPLKKYSWAEVDEAVRAGKIYVVGPKKKLYDITNWLPFHPGGQVVLHAVAGTDVTFDFFNSDPDCSSPVKPELPRPKEKAPVKVICGTNEMSLAQVAKPLSIQDIDPMLRANVLDSYLYPMTLEDKKKVIKCKRSHVHNAKAIDKIDTFCIGEVDVKDFDSREYKRYALTNKTKITPEGHPYKAYRLRFCLVHQNDITTTEHSMLQPFKPGQCIELQCRIGRKYISRYYTPISGNLVAFEVIVRIKDNGQLSNIFEIAKPADRQFKVRGPFGSLVADINHSFATPSSSFRSLIGEDAVQWLPDQIYFFSSGTGITPFLQMINAYFMPVHQPQMVKFNYEAQQKAEISVSSGDMVVPLQHFENGWSAGLNVNTKSIGLFPLSSLVPPTGGLCKFTLVNHTTDGAGTLVGLPELKAALNAFETQGLQVHHFLGIPTNLDHPDLCGNIHVGKMDSNALIKLLGLELEASNPGPEKEAPAFRRKFYVCGNASHVESVSNILINDLKVTPAEVYRLQPDKFV